MSKYSYIYLSGTTINSVDQTSCLFQGAHTKHSELVNKLEEADLRIIPHANDAVRQVMPGVVILSADTDVVVLCLYHWFQLHASRLQELGAENW